MSADKSEYCEVLLRRSVIAASVFSDAHKKYDVSTCGKKMVPQECLIQDEQMDL